MVRKLTRDVQRMTVFSALCLITETLGHGRLMEPPNRSSLWRLKEFESQSPEKNYDDNQLWCGGMGSQYNLSGGKCGPCGDEYLKPRPRENEHGGKYGRGIITRTYLPGQTIPIGVELTVNHLGYFVFSLCPIQLTSAGSLTSEEEECFDKHILPLADASGTKFLVKSNNTGYFKTQVTLPSNLTCKMCVLRWHYRTGNRWNYVNNETGALGIGDQEIFRGCSDITIGSFPADPSTTTAKSEPLVTPPPASAKPIPTQSPPNRPIGTSPTTTVATPTPATSGTDPSTTLLTSSQLPITNRPMPNPTERPRPIPTQRPPGTIPPTQQPKSSTAPPPPSSPASSSTSSTSSTAKPSQHQHPVMHPPQSIILATLLDSLGNSLEK